MPRKTAKVKEKRYRIPLSERLSEETKIRIMKLSGLLLCVFALFSFISVFSYLFTWQADQSLLSTEDMMDKNAEVGNWGGKLGYRWAYFLVCRCFGLGSFFIVALLVFLSARLFFYKNMSGSLRVSVLSLTGAFILSVILSYVSGLVSNDVAFGGGLGGDCGVVISSGMINLAGSIPTGLFIALLAVTWLLFASGSFSRWFVTVGDNAMVRGIRKPVKHGEDGNEDAQVEEETQVHKDEDRQEDAHVEEVRYEVDGDDATAPDHAEDSGAGTPVLHLTDGPDEGKDVSDEGVEVQEGKDLSADVVKDLPRIDVKEELNRYVSPSLDLLNDYAESRHDVPKEELERNNSKIRATLLNYRIQVEKVVACKGPTVTLYKVTPSPGVKISDIRNREEDIAMALGAHGVRVVRLSDTVGIEVPNERPSIVPLKSLLNDDSFRHNKFELPVAIGYTITQKVKVFDLTEAPHLLVAGATKQGKSVGLNVIISSLLYSKHPSELKFVFIDPKMVEFNAYSKLLKHYLAVLPTAASEEDEKSAAIVKTPKQAEAILNSLCIEMDERYKLMSVTSANNVKLYNEKFKDRHLNPQEGHRYLPYIVAVIDEYADLVMSVGTGAGSKTQTRNITTSIIRLAQKGRAAGIHVIIATQRPSVDVVTGIIKTNFPMRIAFRTATRQDSMTILDSPGAEKLIGKGDMLYYAGVEIERVQCAMISMDEIYKVTDYIGAQTGYRQCYNTAYYLPEPVSPESSDAGASGHVDMQKLDDKFREAAEYVVMKQKGSTSDLQRNLEMGYARAGRVMDQLEAAGIVGPQEGAKPRRVLVADLNELESILEAYIKS